jgi:glutamate dehydrogenase
LSHKSFVFLGYREYALERDGAAHATTRAHTGLGLLRDPSASRWISGAEIPPAIASQLGGAPLVLMSKTNALSPVHRPDAMDDIAIKEIDAGGAVVGVRRLLGLFTFGAEGKAASEIPILRQRLAAILELQGVVADSHDARNLTDLFNSFPREELLTSRVEDVFATIRAIIAAESALHVDLCCHADTAGRGVFVNVLLPRARYSTELGGRITAAVTRHLNAPILLDQLALDERTVARLHFHVAVDPSPLPAAAIAALREELRGLLRTWDDALGDALAALVPRAQHAELVARYRAAFPPPTRPAPTSPRRRETSPASKRCAPAAKRRSSWRARRRAARRR